MEFEFYAVTHQGLVRQNNEDFYLIPEKQHSNEGLCIVADGMGGHKAGEVASSLAVHTFAESFESFYEKDAPVSEKLTNALMTANNAVVAEQEANIFLSNMGTTLTACYVVDNSAYFINVGDSRAYLIRKGASEKITNDHSVVQELLDKKVITPKEAVNHPQKNVITRAVGLREGVRGDLFLRTVEKDDFILLCSDGLTNQIPMDNLGLLFDTSCTSQSIAETLRDLALAEGGQDNITVVIIRCL